LADLDAELKAAADGLAGLDAAEAER